MTRQKRSWLRNVVDTATVLVLVVAVMSWTRRGRAEPTLESRYAESAVATGAILPQLVVQAESGPLAVPTTDRGAVYLIFSSGCPYCIRSAPTWQAIANGLPDDVPVIALSAESISIAAEWLNGHQILSHAIGRIVDVASLEREWGISTVPQTIAIKDGIVAYAGSGVFDRTRLDSLLKVFD